MLAWIALRRDQVGVKDPLIGYDEPHLVALVVHELEEVVLFYEVGAVRLNECLAGPDPLEQLLLVRPSRRVLG